jgi:hypothetical protein
MILMVAAVKINFIFVDEETCKENHSYFYGVTPPVNKISIEYVRVMNRWKTILK